jgi:hypothetical protein
MAELLTDKQRFLEFQSYLSPAVVELMERLISNDQFLESVIVKILAYNEYAQNFIPPLYDNKIMEKSFVELNKRLLIFEDALVNSAAPHHRQEGHLTLSKVPKVKNNLIQSFALFKDTYWNFTRLAKGEFVKIAKTNMGKRLIIKDNMTGIFYYKKTPIEFGDATTIYNFVFRILFDESDANGFCSYAAIENGLRKNKKPAILDKKKQIQRIDNAIKSLFRYARNLPKMLPDSKPLITKKRGKGLILHNPEKK